MVQNYYSPTLEDALLSHDNCGVYNNYSHYTCMKTSNIGRSGSLQDNSTGH